MRPLTISPAAAALVVTTLAATACTPYPSGGARDRAVLGDGQRRLPSAAAPTRFYGGTAPGMLVGPRQAAVGSAATTAAAGGAFALDTIVGTVYVANVWVLDGARETQLVEALRGNPLAGVARQGAAPAPELATVLRARRGGEVVRLTRWADVASARAGLPEMGTTPIAGVVPTRTLVYQVSGSALRPDAAYQPDPAGNVEWSEFTASSPAGLDGLPELRAPGDLLAADPTLRGVTVLRGVDSARVALFRDRSATADADATRPMFEVVATRRAP